MKMKRKGMGKGLGKGYYNLAPLDSHIHSLSAKGVKTAYNLKIFDPDGEVIQNRYFQTKERAENEIKKIEREIREKIPKEDYDIDEISLEAKGMTKAQKEKRRKELFDKAQSRFNSGGGGRFDPINHLFGDEDKEFMRLEYELGYSDYDPDEE